MKNLIDTPYGRKSPELLCAAMDAYTVLPQLLDALRLVHNSSDLQLATNSNGVHSAVSYAIKAGEKVKVL